MAADTAPGLAAYVLRKAVASLPLLLGVTLLSFTLMVYFGPDLSQLLVGRNATAEELEAARRALGYDQPFLVRYLDYLRELVTLDFGNAFSGEPVARLLARTLPVTLALVLPGFVLGNAAGLALALTAARWYRRWPDRLVTVLATATMSVSFLIVVIVCQVAFSSTDGLGWFPVRGWRVWDAWSYLQYVTVPTLALTVAAIGYNTRFYRSALVAELERDHVRTALAYGAPRWRTVSRDVLRNAAIPIVTRMLFSLPVLVISGSLVLEQYFGIPGIGQATYQAITSGDQPVLKAVVSVAAVAFVLLQVAADALYALLDPRVVIA